MDPWVKRWAAATAEHAIRELEALVGVSSPSGDVRGAEEAIAVSAALLPARAALERVPCSTPEHAPDLIARLRGTGRRRLLLVGHLDTVVAHEAHRPLEVAGERLVGSGTVDMKGGVVLALGAMRALAEVPERYAEATLLLVVDEEWRTTPFAHARRFAGWDACLCFEAGQLRGDEEAVVVRRKAAGTMRVHARGASAHSGSAPDRGANALLALAEAARAVAARHDPSGPDRLTAVPTVMRAGDAFNVVPAAGELVCDLRADRLAAFGPVLEAVPADVGGAALRARSVREWPPMDTRAAAGPLLERASALLGRRIAPAERGGASDASNLAGTIPATVDGLGPRGGAAHNPDEYVLAASVGPRADIALALVAAALA
jgi:glutamate carboxypeptidase